MFGKLKRKKTESENIPKAFSEETSENELKSESETEETGIKKRKKKKDKKEKKIHKNILKTMNIMEFTKEGSIKTKEGYLDIVEVEGKDIFALKDDEIHRDISVFHSFYKVTGADIKVVTMKFPVNAETQKSYLLYKIDKTDNSIHKKFLRNKLLELEYLERNRSNKEHYLFVFSEKEENLKSTIKTAIRVLQNSISVRELDQNKKIIILKKLYNRNSNIDQNLKIGIDKKEERN